MKLPFLLNQSNNKNQIGGSLFNNKHSILELLHSLSIKNEPEKGGDKIIKKKFLKLIPASKTKNIFKKIKIKTRKKIKKLK